MLVVLLLSLGMIDGVCWLWWFPVGTGHHGPALRSTLIRSNDTIKATVVDVWVGVRPHVAWEHAPPNLTMLGITHSGAFVNRSYMRASVLRLSTRCSTVPRRVSDNIPSAVASGYAIAAPDLDDQDYLIIDGEANTIWRITWPSPLPAAFLLDRSFQPATGTACSTRLGFALHSGLSSQHFNVSGRLSSESGAPRRIKIHACHPLDLRDI